LPLVVRRRVTFVAKAEYFDNPKTAWFFRGVGQIPIRREGGSASERALASATEVLMAGKIFGIYPEGTRTRDGMLHRGHTGVARLALRCNAPVVPVGMIGSDEVQPIDSKMPKLFRHVTIRFGEPVDTGRYAGRHNDHLALREFTDEVMYEICQLSGYEYVDTYATKKAEDLPTDVAHVANFDELRAATSAAS
jgi:1-acyl-sn-glycerol-3-phosphate acyltransferase